MRRCVWTWVATAGLWAIAAPASAGVHWTCGLSDDSVRLVCVADPDPSSLPVVQPQGPTVGGVVSGTRFPLNPDEVYTVELWGVPDDADWLAQLARATICFRSPGCTVSVAPVQGLDAPRWR